MMRLLLAIAFLAVAVNGSGDEGAATHPPRSQRPAHNAPTSRTAPARRRFQPTRPPSLAAFEWAGTFDVADMNTVFWSAQSDAEGHYPDASMKIVIMQGNADNSLTENLEEAGEASLEGTCTELQPGDPLPISSTGTPPGTPLQCYKLMFPCTMEGSGDDAECHADAHTAIWEIDTTGYDNIAVFAEHFPTEFEREAADRH